MVACFGRGRVGMGRANALYGHERWKCGDFCNAYGGREKRVSVGRVGGRTCQLTTSSLGMCAGTSAST